MKITNNYTRTLGVPGKNESIIIAPTESAEITEDDLSVIKSNKTASLWIADGLLSVDGETELGNIVGALVVEPNNTDSVDVVVGGSVITEDGAEVSIANLSEETATVKHVGGGRWNAFVNGEPLSEETLDKEEAEALVVEYNAPN